MSNMAIARITQMARGRRHPLHRRHHGPSVDVTPASSRQNHPARIAFQVAAKVDSRTNSRRHGAPDKNSSAKGDMPLSAAGIGQLVPPQGALITTRDHGIVEFIARQGKPRYRWKSTSSCPVGGSLATIMGIDEDEDLIQQCVDVIRTSKKPSVSLLQTPAARLGYTRPRASWTNWKTEGIVGGQRREPRRHPHRSRRHRRDGRANSWADFWKRDRFHNLRAAPDRCLGVFRCACHPLGIKSAANRAIRHDRH